MKDKYLISADNMRVAKSIARGMSLKENEWRHIPSNGFDRKRKLMGCRVSDEKYLIGFFTEEEVMYLYPPYCVYLETISHTVRAHKFHTH